MLVACGVSGGSDDGPTPADDARPTLDELEALLPEAADLGEGYELVSSNEDPTEADDDDDDPMGLDSALDDACGPAVTDWMDAGGDGPDEDEEVVRHFSTDVDQTVQTDIGFTSREVSDDQLAELIDALRDCEQATVDLPDGSLDVQISASEEAEIGDQAVRVFMDLTMHIDGLPQPITVSMEGITYVRGPVTVMVMVGDGLDERTLRAVPGDVHLIDSLATEIDTALVDLLG